MSGTLACERCGRRVPKHPGYVTWCECGWNLEPQLPPSQDGAWAKLYAELGRRRGKLRPSRKR